MLQGPTARRRTHADRLRTGRRPRSLRMVLAGLLAGAALIGSATPALAVPAPPANPSDGQIDAARAAQDAAAAEVGRIAALVAGAEAELERLSLQAEAAGAAYLAAEEARQIAQAAADEAAAQLQAAADAVAVARARIGEFARESYMNGSQLSTTQALLDADGPAELVQRAALLEYVGDTQVDVLDSLEVARVQQANAESVARATRDQAAAAEAQAEAAKVTADGQVAAQQAAYGEISAQKAQYDQQLEAANIQLLELQGARDAYAQWQAQKAAEEAAAAAAAERAAREAAAAAAAARAQAGSGGGGGGGGSAASGGSGPYVMPTSGRTSSCFGTRWGTLHGGVDVAAPIGTPVYAVHSGTVLRAGTATGFGYAVYIRGDDGFVTVYGHVHEYFVRAGERVSAGEQIATVGNRGQSTGPHLHFEVHPAGSPYTDHMNPAPWLRARGVAFSGC
ncbi:M23 family metallopeptidase [Trujillonella endophytica]|uniref:Murein DD-endopeptidase MepM and murein hydrolase activator NlpD, contain LysM domain n=1 Tax=Trujillonella endophytica TaxID=673521 RepID=A0A1H8UHA0_9ACTN|nr:M23 family metallopeptidase [Trujillella endophytica]SEP02600.1 Murein DD-endopeptidase MepM and murein hydrolase activator NlpD, contain LysM domain [Trujillella endophytica]